MLTAMNADMCSKCFVTEPCVRSFIRALNLSQQGVARQTKSEDVDFVVLDENAQFAAKLSAVAKEPELARVIASRRLQFTMAIRVPTLTSENRLATSRDRIRIQP